jgi:SP family xylose:H+ symportor-like MFS transporter
MQAAKSNDHWKATHMNTDQHRGGAYVLLLTGVAALGGMLFGYDTAVISGAIGFLSEHFQLDPQLWKGWAAASALAGCALGAAMAGMLSDRFGRRGTLLAAAVLFFISAVGTALPRTFAEFVFYRIVGGLGVGAASMTSPMYIAEISPARIRGRMVSINQFAIIAGMLVVYFVNYFIAQYGASMDQIAGAAEGTWNVRLGWRWMFASEALPAGLFFALLFFVPESPRWLVMRGREERAVAVLARVGGDAHAAAEIADIRDALARETGSWAELLQPGMRVVLAVGVVLAILQQVTGINVFLYFAPEIFRKLGTGTNAALLQTVLVGAVNLTFTIVAIWTVDLVGRKPLMLLGAGGMGVCLLAMGMAAYWQRTEVWMLAFVLGYIACFALSVGPVTWVILAEIFPTALRGRAMAVATVCLWIANYLVTQTFTIMDESPTLVERFHHGLPFWVYAAFCAVSVVFVWRWVPETKGKTLEQIQRELAN